MARLRDSRSPNPAGSQQSSRKLGRDDAARDRDRGRDRDLARERDRDRDRDRRDHGGRLSRSRSPPDRRYRDRDGHHDYRRRERSPERRDDAFQRGSARDRRRSRDRFGDRDRDRSSDGRRRRSRDRDANRDNRSRRDDSRDRNRGRREGTADSHPRSRRDGSRDHGSGIGAQKVKSAENADARATAAAAAVAQAEADKKAERLAKLAAWKKKQEEKEKQKEATPGGTRQLLAEMDKKANGSPAHESPSVASPATAGADASPSNPQVASPATSYAGKFDPKAIAKKSAAKLSSGAGSILGAIDGKTVVANVTTKIGAPSVSSLPQSRAKTSGFGFHKLNAEGDKVTQKRKLDLDEDEASDRKLTKLPSLPMPDADDTAIQDLDEDDDEDADNFVGSEEEEAAAARAAQERREERIAQESAQQGEPMEVDGSEEEHLKKDTPADPPTNGAVPEPVVEPPTAEVMEVEEQDDEDPLDAFMNDLEARPTKKVAKAGVASKTKQQEQPEAYFSDDEYDFSAKQGGGGDSFLAAVAKARKKKDIPSVDYTKLDLAPVRKNFWVEPSELSEMTEADLVDLRLELDGIKVSGKDVPKPVQKWSQLALSRTTLDIVESLGFEKPTPIQMQAFPAIMSGRDIIGIAKTGSGKTVAFLLPMFRHIKDQEPLKENDGPIALIMTPTRELATQIHRDCKSFLKSMNLRAVCAYGGAPIKDHIAELKRGAEIVVCTPGRMIDLLAANQGRVTNLKRVTYVVLDEADRMFDMGFEPQVMKILSNMRPDRQNILFSATMPRIMDALAKKVLNNPIEITVGGRSVVAAEITQIVEIREEKDKFIRLLELLGELYDTDEEARSLIFVERQEKADELLKELLQKGYPCMSIHGGKDQIDRDSTIQDFKAGIVPILIATSVAARGLDVKQLKLVVNYDAPNHLEDYVHRAGRTGRAGNKGTAVTFVTSDQENCAPGIAKALEQSGQPIPEQLEEMRKAFRDKVKTGKAKDQTGFGGKGLDRLDQEREATRARERKSHRTEGEEDEPDKDDKKKKKEEESNDKATAAIQAAASSVKSRDTAPRAPEVLDTTYVIHKREDAPAATATTSSSKDPLDRVSARVADINARLGKSGQLRPGQPIDNKGPDAGAYHATLEIHDFPQKARWAVTNRTNVAKILEATGTSITTKGSYYGVGKGPGPNELPKLYILVEGDTELVVANAMQELTRLLKEGAQAAEIADGRAPVGGRYTVT